MRMDLAYVYESDILYVQCVCEQVCLGKKEKLSNSMSGGPAFAACRKDTAFIRVTVIYFAYKSAFFFSVF